MSTYSLAIEVLAVPTRRAILERLRRGPLAAGEIASGLPVTRPAVSQHLKILKDAGLVTSHRMGTRQIYAMDRSGFHDLRAYVESFWTAALDGFAAAAGRAAGKSDPADNTSPRERVKSQKSKRRNRK